MTDGFTALLPARIRPWQRQGAFVRLFARSDARAYTLEWKKQIVFAVMAAAAVASRQPATFQKRLSKGESERDGKKHKVSNVMT